MWVLYHGSIRGRHSIFRSRPLSSLERSDLERGTSLPTVLAGGSSTATSFPLQQEEPSSFAYDMTGIWTRKIDGEVLRKKTWWRERMRKFFWTNDGKGNSLSTNDNKGDVKGCNGLVVKRSIVLMKQGLCFRIIAKLGNSKRQHYSQ